MLHNSLNGSVEKERVAGRGAQQSRTRRSVQLDGQLIVSDGIVFTKLMEKLIDCFYCWNSLLICYWTRQLDSSFGWLAGKLS